MTKRPPAAPIVPDEVAGCLANASRKPLSDAEIEALIKARLKAEDEATMQRPVKVVTRQK